MRALAIKGWGGIAVLLAVLFVAGCTMPGAKPIPVPQAGKATQTLAYWDVKFQEQQDFIRTYVKQPPCGTTMIVGCADRDVKKALQQAEDAANMALRTAHAIQRNGGQPDIESLRGVVNKLINEAYAARQRRK